jgi:hypothetical protein
VRRRAAGLLAGCALICSSVLAAAAPALASSGVSVDIGRIDITEQLSPGAAYNLPTIGVRNPGTERTSYSMVANPVSDPGRVAPPSSWFRFEPSHVTLDPGQTTPVRVRLVVPTDAQPGDYIALVGAEIVTVGSGTTVGAAAAARTTFTIKPANAIQAIVAWLGQQWNDFFPWSAIVPAIVVVAFGLWVARRRFTFGLTIERRGG